MFGLPRIGSKPPAIPTSPHLPLMLHIPSPLTPTRLSFRRTGVLVVVAGTSRNRANTRTEDPKVRNRRFRLKFNGTARKPRLSVFCSEKQLYAMLVDDHNKKTLFYGSTLQKSIRQDPPCTTIEAAQRVGEELIKACVNLNITEISSYDRNGFARGEKMQAFEIPIAQFGFLLR